MKSQIQKNNLKAMWEKIFPLFLFSLKKVVRKFNKLLLNVKIKE